MILNSARLVDKDVLDSCNCTGEFISHLADSLWRDISNQIIHELCTKEECIFKLYPLTQIDVPETCQYEIRQRIACIKLIRCEKCKHRDEDGYCNKIEKFVPCDFFCQMGREKDCKDCKDCEDCQDA